jgi:hypothetical protein
MQGSFLAREDDATAHTVAYGVGNGTTSSFGNNNALGSGYQYSNRQMDINPLTSTNWSTTDPSTLQIGVEQTA